MSKARTNNTASIMAQKHIHVQKMQAENTSTAASVWILSCVRLIAQASIPPPEERGPLFKGS